MLGMLRDAVSVIIMGIAEMLQFFTWNDSHPHLYGPPILTREKVPFSEYYDTVPTRERYYSEEHGEEYRGWIDSLDSKVDFLPALHQHARKCNWGPDMQRHAKIYYNNINKPSCRPFWQV